MIVLSRIGLRRRFGFARAAVGLIVLVAVLAGCAGQDSATGAATPEDAVKSYVDALNNDDEAALRRLAATDNDAVDAGVKKRLADFGGRDIRITSRVIDHGPAPHQASARLSGELNPAGTAYREQLFLNSADGRWYLSLHDGPASTVSPLPPAGTERP